MKAVVAAFNQEKALVGAFSVSVQLHRLIVYSTRQAAAAVRWWRVSVEVCGMLLLFLGVDKINFSDISLLRQRQEFRNIFSCNDSNIFSSDGVKYFPLSPGRSQRHFVAFCLTFVRI